MREKNLKPLTSIPQYGVIAAFNSVPIKEKEYVYYHPVINELFTLPMKPEKKWENTALDVEFEGYSLLTGVYYIGEF